MAEAQGGVAGDAAPAMDDLRHPVGRYLDLAGEFGGRDTDLLQFVGKDLAGMGGWAGHELHLSSDSPWFRPVTGGQVRGKVGAPFPGKSKAMITVDVGFVIRIFVDYLDRQASRLDAVAR